MISNQDGADFEFVVDGWHQEWEVHDDGDVRKLWHEAVHEDGRREVLDWSPYSYISREQFAQLVRLGFPRRTGGGPLSPEEVERLWGEAAARCPSCGGLNLSCPDGCGRDPETGELNGTRLE